MATILDQLKQTDRQHKLEQLDNIEGCIKMLKIQIKDKYDRANGQHGNWFPNLKKQWLHEADIKERTINRLKERFNRILNEIKY